MLSLKTFYLLAFIFFLILSHNLCMDCHKQEYVLMEKENYN